MKTLHRVRGLAPALLLVLLVVSFGGCSSPAGGSASVIAVPEVPTGLSAVGANAQVVLTWGDTSTATGYAVYRSTTLGTQGTKIGTSSSTGYTDTTPTNGTLYYYRVTATNAGGESVASSQTFAIPYADRSSMAHGADVSWVSQFEANGTTWQNPSAVAVDPIVYLKSVGVDAIRLRVMVNPGSTSYLTSDGYMMGYCDQAGMVALATRCQAAGITKFLIDFHFSDKWASPSAQSVPAAWSGHTVAQLATDISDHVTAVLTALVSAGITPTWVQLGNEETGGILWGSAGSGKVSYTSASNWSNLATLLNAGYAAVKAVNSSIQVVLHLDKGGRNALYRGWFDYYKAAGGQWDIIGLSFYPYWQSSDTVAMLQANLNDMVSRYSKPVMVVEVGGLASNPAATKILLNNVKAAVASVPNEQGLGVFYWEPESASASIGGAYVLGACTQATTTALRFTTAMTGFGYSN